MTNLFGITRSTLALGQLGFSPKADREQLHQGILKYER